MANEETLLKDANRAIDPIRAAIIETCKREGIAALAILIGLEAGHDGVEFEEWSSHCRALMFAGHFMGAATRGLAK